MRKKCMIILFLAISTFSLTSCTSKKTYSVKEQQRVLKLYDEDFYDLTFFNDNEVKDGNSYLIPGLFETKVPLLNESNKISTSYSMDPQGITIAENYLLISSYSHDKKHNSVVYVIDRNSRKHLKTIILEGNPHVGGITYDPIARNVWVCSSTLEGQAELIAFSMDTLQQYSMTPKYEPIEYDQKIELEGIRKSSFITYHEKALFVGYFSLDSTSILEEYHFNEHGVFQTEIKNKTELIMNDQKLDPNRKIAIPKEIQGITFYKNFILLSKSYGDKESEILIYKFNKNQEHTQDDFIKKIRAPPYLEQISVEGNQLFSIFESGTERLRNKKNLTVVYYVVPLNLEKIFNQWNSFA